MSVERNCYLPDLHLSEQYFTFSQSRAHFFRHSNSLLQRTQTFGAKPFFILAFIKHGLFNGLELLKALLRFVVAT